MREGGGALGGGVSASTCRPALPSPGPESSSERLAGLERQLGRLQEEKMQLSRELQGTGEPAGPRRCGSDPGATAGPAPHRQVPPSAEALQVSSDPQELERLRKEVQTLQDRLSGIPPPAPPPLSAILSGFPSTLESSLGSSPARLCRRVILGK